MLDDRAVANLSEKARAYHDLITPAKEKRLGKMFDTAERQQPGQGNPNYPVDLLEECVTSDPWNLTYVEKYYEAVKSLYKNNKKGAPLSGLKIRGPQTAMKKSTTQEEWGDALEHGIKALRLNPWNIQILFQFAEVAEALGAFDTELFFYKCALEAKPKDYDVNMRCALALRERGQYDQALHCLNRAEQAKGDVEEIKALQEKLLIEKTTSGVKDVSSLGKAKLSKGGGTVAQAAAKASDAGLSPEELLKKTFKEDPSDVDVAIKLSNLLIEGDKYAEAENVLATAYKKSDRNAQLQERHEDCQIRHLRHKISHARSKNDKELDRRLQMQLLKLEIKVYEGRVERSPTNLVLHYELGTRYRRGKKYQEAIAELQKAQADPRRKGLSLLELGKCFQLIKQNQLAASHYEKAIAEISDREETQKKEAMYLAGKLAYETQKLDLAQDYFSKLAEIDFSYKDVQAILDRIARKTEG